MNEPLIILSRSSSDPNTDIILSSRSDAIAIRGISVPSIMKFLIIIARQIVLSCAILSIVFLYTKKLFSLL